MLRLFFLGQLLNALVSGPILELSSCGGDRSLYALLFARTRVPHIDKVSKIVRWSRNTLLIHGTRGGKTVKEAREYCYRNEARQGCEYSGPMGGFANDHDHCSVGLGRTASNVGEAYRGLEPAIPVDFSVPRLFRDQRFRRFLNECVEYIEQRLCSGIKVGASDPHERSRWVFGR